MSKLFKFVVPAFVLIATLAVALVGAPSQVSGDGHEFEPMTYAAESCDYAGGGPGLLSIEAVDELTVKFTLCTPDPAFPSKVAFSAFAIQSADHLVATGGGGDLLDTPVGTGPYMLGEWVKGDSITLQRFDDYWGGAAPMETVVFRWNSEAAARLVELQAGTIDGMDNPGSDDFASIREDDSLALYDRPGTNIFYVGFTNWHEPYDNVQVRQAIAMSVDKQRIVDNFYPAGSIVADQFMPPSLFGFTPEVNWYDFDPAAGMALLEEAGLGDGFELSIFYRDVVRSYLPEPGVVAQDIAAQLEENLGLTVSIVVMESGDFLDASNRGDLNGLHLLGWGADYPDATNFLDYHFGATSSDQFGDHHDAITENLTAGGQLADPAERYPYYIAANQAIKDLVPMIPIAHGGSGTAFKAGVEGAHASPLGNEYFAAMSIEGQDTLVWMQNAEPLSLYCADESDGETLRACEQVFEQLLAYEVGGTAVVPALAESYEVSEDLQEWTFSLRPDVMFHDGSMLDANDVVMSYAAQWDASSDLHVGREGSFYYFQADFGALLNEAE